MKTVGLRLDIIKVDDDRDTILMSDGDVRQWVRKDQIQNYDPDWELLPQTVDAEIPDWLAGKIGWI